MRRIKVVPFYATDTEELFFADDAVFNFPSILRSMSASAGYDLSIHHEYDVSDYVLLFRLDLRTALQLWQKRLFDRVLYVAMEPPVVRPLHAPENLRRLARQVRNVFTWQDDLIRECGMEKFHFPTPRRVRPSLVPFSQRKLITAVVGNKSSLYRGELYSERIYAFRFFEKAIGNDFEFYGEGWGGRRFKSWRGAVDDKLATLSNYRFSICYENQKNINGLFSEKIFDSMLARCVPIFWGAENVDDYIPKLCFIDARAFPSYKALYDYLVCMSEMEYSDRLLAIDEFLASETFSLFSGEDFAFRLIKVLNASEAELPQQTLLPILKNVALPVSKDLVFRVLSRLIKVGL